MSDSSSFRPDASRAWLALALIVLVALCVVFAIQTERRATRPDGNDFTIYLHATRALWSGENPYTAAPPFAFIYPLFLCVLLAPIAHLPYAASVAIWYGLNVAALGLALALVLRLHGPSVWPRRMVVSLAGVCVLMGGVIQGNMRNGQVNPIVLALCVVFAWCYLGGQDAFALHASAGSRRGLGAGRRHAASLALGAAIALKLTPAILLLFLIRRRAWTVAAEALAATALFLGALPWLVAGDRVREFYGVYVGTFLRARLTGVELIDPVTFSLAGVWRAFSSADAASDALVFAVLATLALWIIDRGEGPEDRRTSTILLCLYLAASLLVTPMSEFHHLVYLMPGLAILTWRTATQDGGGRSRAPLQGLIALGALYLALIAISARMPTAFGGVIGTCALLVAAVIRERVHRRASEAGPPYDRPDTPAPRS